MGPPKLDGRSERAGAVWSPHTHACAIAVEVSIVLTCSLVLGGGTILEQRGGGMGGREENEGQALGTRQDKDRDERRETK